MSEKKLRAEISKNAKIVEKLLSRMEKHLEQGDDDIAKVFTGFKEEVEKLSSDEMARALLYMAGKIALDSYSSKHALAMLSKAVLEIGSIVSGEGCQDPNCPHCRAKNKSDKDDGTSFSA